MIESEVEYEGYPNSYYYIYEYIDGKTLKVSLTHKEFVFYSKLKDIESKLDQVLTLDNIWRTNNE